MGETSSLWSVLFTKRFELWLEQQDEPTKISVYAALQRLELYGPHLARPYADSIYNSMHSNMKELRIQHKGKPIRAFFAFDPLRQAIVLCAGDKSNDKKFYERMIAIADQEFVNYLATME